MGNKADKTAKPSRRELRQRTGLAVEKAAEAAADVVLARVDLVVIDAGVLAADVRRAVTTTFEQSMLKQAKGGTMRDETSAPEPTPGEPAPDPQPDPQPDAPQPGEGNPEPGTKTGPSGE